MLLNICEKHDTSPFKSVKNIIKKDITLTKDALNSSDRKCIHVTKKISKMLLELSIH